MSELKTSVEIQCAQPLAFNHDHLMILPDKKFAAVKMKRSPELFAVRRAVQPMPVSQCALRPVFKNHRIDPHVLAIGERYPVALRNHQRVKAWQPFLDPPQRRCQTTPRRVFVAVGPQLGRQFNAVDAAPW